MLADIPGSVPSGIFKKLDFLPGEVRMEFDGCHYGIGYEGDLKPSQNGWTLYPINGKGAIQF